MVENINSNVYNIIDIVLKDGQHLHFDNCINIKIPMGYMRFNLGDELTSIYIDNYYIRSIDIEETDMPYIPQDKPEILCSQLDLYYKGYKINDADHFGECTDFEFDTEIFKFKCKNESGKQCYHKGQIREIYMFKKADIKCPYEVKEVEGVPCNVIQAKEGNALNYRIYGNDVKVENPKNLYGFNEDKTETANGVTCTYDKATGIFAFNGKMESKKSTDFMILENVLKLEPDYTYQLHSYYVGGSISGEFPQYNGGFWIVPRGTRKEGSDFAYGMVLDKLNADKPMKIENFTVYDELSKSSLDFSLSDDCLLKFDDFKVKIMLECSEEPTDYEMFGAEYNHVGKLIGNEQYLVKVNDKDIILPKCLSAAEYTDFGKQTIGEKSCYIPPLLLSEGDNVVMTDTSIDPGNIYVKYYKE